jgi:integrase
MTTTRGRGRPPTGTVRFIKGKWRGKFTRADKSRTPWRALDPKIAVDEESAKVAAARMALKVMHASAGQGKRETVAAYAKRWLDDRDGRVKSLRSDRARLSCHVLDLIGPDDVRTIGREGIELVRDALDRKIAGAELSWKTAANVWTVVTSMFDDAKNSKKAALRVREDNPCNEVRPPDRGAKKQKQYLHPSEFLRFVSCERIPLRWRRAVAVAVYSYARDGELRALAWDGGDVDMEHGALSIARAYNQNTKKTEHTKTGETRRFNVERNLLPLLKAMRAEAKGKGSVLSLPPQGNGARKLRRYLKVAGVERPELHKGTPTRKPLTWHDLRATGITWCAVRGDEPMKIMQRAGHTTFSTTQGYIRTAENMRSDFGDVFPRLPGCLLNIVPISSGTKIKRTREPKTSRSVYRRRDSNPHALSDGGF